MSYAGRPFPAAACTTRERAYRSGSHRGSAPLQGEIESPEHQPRHAHHSPEPLVSIRGSRVAWVQNHRAPALRDHRHHRHHQAVGPTVRTMSSQPSSVPNRSSRSPSAIHPHAVSSSSRRTGELVGQIPQSGSCPRYPSGPSSAFRTRNLLQTPPVAGERVVSHVEDRQTPEPREQGDRDKVVLGERQLGHVPRVIGFDSKPAVHCSASWVFEFSPPVSP